MNYMHQAKVGPLIRKLEGDIGCQIEMLSARDLSRNTFICIHQCQPSTE